MGYETGLPFPQYTHGSQCLVEPGLLVAKSRKDYMEVAEGPDRYNGFTWWSQLGRMKTDAHTRAKRLNVFNGWKQKTHSRLDLLLKNYQVWMLNF